MKIETVKQYQYTNTLARFNMHVLSPKAILPYPQQDLFVRTSPKDISFHGGLKFTDLITKYLKSRTYNTAIKGSKRPYLSIDEQLVKNIKEIKIKVSPKEEINAWDINPKHSNKYIIFLHGFSQNITNNQPLYKTLTNTDFGILAIDYRSYGKNKPSKHITEDDIVQDVKSSVKYLSERGITDIGLVGHSFGSYIASKTSKTNPFKFQVLVSPMISLEFWLKNVLKHPKKYKNETKMIKYIPKFKDQYSKIFNIKKYLIDNQTPTYVIQAKRDMYIRTSKVNQLTSQIPNLKSYIVLPQGGHRMDDNKIQAIEGVLNKL